MKIIFYYFVMLFFCWLQVCYCGEIDHYINSYVDWDPNFLVQIRNVIIYTMPWYAQLHSGSQKTSVKNIMDLDHKYAVSKTTNVMSGNEKSLQETKGFFHCEITWAVIWCPSLSRFSVCWNSWISSLFAVLSTEMLSFLICKYINQKLYLVKLQFLCATEHLTWLWYYCFIELLNGMY